MNAKLKLILIAYSAMLVEAKNSMPYCDVLSNDPTKQCYIKEILLSITHSPNQLAVDRQSNNLYFSFDSGQGEYAAAILRLDSKKFTVLKGVKDAFAISYDVETSEIYFGGSHGIYKYNTLNRQLKRLNKKRLDIWWLFVRNAINFIKFPSLNAYYYKNQTVKEIPELKQKVVHQFVIDKEGNIYFINSTGLYGVKRDTKEAVSLRNHPRFHGMAIDNKDYVHICSEDGIYIITKMVQKVKKIINVQGVLGITFDKLNNIIYSDWHELVRLVPTMTGDRLATRL